MKRLILLLFLIGGSNANSHATRIDFEAAKGADIARGFFEWMAAAPISSSIFNSAGDGKILWEISGGISLNSTMIFPMTRVILEVMDNWSIDAPAPGTLIGDQITLFGTAHASSGIRSVANFIFRDETGLLFSSVSLPTHQSDFDQFADARADLILVSDPSMATTFRITKWQVQPANDADSIPEPGTFGLALLGLVGSAFFTRRSQSISIATGE
tara:strand:- start:382 stop:1023 length:642 start_codon:yes stop_codon:yes gene_type:complete